MEISPGGAFQASSINAPPSPTGKRKSYKTGELSSKLVVSEAWCLYSRSKPSSVWARDANALADRIALPEHVGETLPLATWSLTHGPSKLEQFLQDQRKLQDMESGKGSRSNASSSASFSGWLASNFVSRDSTENMELDDGKKDEKSLIFPLATSDSQHRIADLLLHQNYPAVLAEGRFAEVLFLWGDLVHRQGVFIHRLNEMLVFLF
jgi:hypothetical protein